ncbi:MAG: hypothetical protein DMG30_25655 [Acidobacteria bacterium]|nr:MAG: hypothetical protein DMG30_25655 [Acidobacteriota bacterium]
MEGAARRAHELYVQRGGEHRKDVEDWVRAEKELGRRTSRGTSEDEARSML